MNIRLLLIHIRHWAVLAVLPALVVGSGVYLYERHLPPIYQATATLYVQASSTNSVVPGGMDAQNTQLLTPSYSKMITDPVIAGSVDLAMSARYPGYKLEKHVVSASTPAQQTTTLITVGVTDTVPSRAAAAANAITRAFIDRVHTLEAARFKRDEQSLLAQINQIQQQNTEIRSELRSPAVQASQIATLQNTLSAYQATYQTLLLSLGQFRTTRDATENNVSVYSPATPPINPTGPHPLRTASLAAIIALLLCVAGVLVYDYLDDSLRTPEEVEEIIDAPILGTVQHFATGRKDEGALVVKEHPRSPVTEAYRHIRTNLQFASVDRPLRTVLFTSMSPREGKSTTVSNLAQVFAESGARVTVVDADLRRPTLHRIFNVERRRGLTNLLSGSVPLNGYGIESTDHSNLMVVASGPLPPRPADLLGSERMGSVIEHLRGKADMLLIDSPPILAVTDAAVLSTMVDGVVLVVDPGKTQRRELHRAREAIEGVGGKIVGVVINRLNTRNAGYYYYYQYNYAYSYRYVYDSQPERAAAGATKPEKVLRG